MTVDASPPEALPTPCALFLDFDGSLVEIAPRPQDVVVGAWLVPLLQALHTALDGALAIVSGRPLEQLDHHLARLRLPAAGVHGVERRDAAGRMHLHGRALPADVLELAQQLCATHPGLRLELKPSALALHYRAVPQWGELCEQSLLAAVRPHAAWVAMSGKCVVEVKPRGISKAHAVSAFMAEPPFVGRVPVFLGDDVTDEDGFVAVQKSGGFGIKVGPGASAARHGLADTDAVRRWLQAVATQTRRAAPQPSSA